MAICRNPETVQACFTPSDGSPSVSILHTTLFDVSGKAFSAYYHDEAGNIIDSATFMGGGTAKIGQQTTADQPVTTCYELTTNINNGGNTRNVGPAVGTSFSHLSSADFVLDSFNANFDDTGNVDGYTVTNVTTGESTTTNGFTWTGTFSQLSQGVFNLEDPLEVNNGDLLTFVPIGTPTGRFLRFNFTNTSQVFVGLDGVGDGVNMLRVQLIGIQHFTVLEDGGDITATNDATGDEIDVSAGIPTEWVEVSCDAPIDRVQLTPECKQQIADLIGNKLLSPLGETCYLTDIDENSPFTREVVISNLDVERGPVFNQAGSNNMPWNNGPVFLMNGGDGDPIYERYELVSLKVFGDVNNVTAQPTQVRSNSATMTGSLASPVVVGNDQLIEFNFDQGQIFTNLGTNGAGSLPMRLDPTLGSGQMGYTTRPIPVGNQMTFGGGTAGQEIYGELTILLQERLTVRVASFVNKETGEICNYRQDAAGAWSELSAIPEGWDICPTPSAEIVDALDVITPLTKTVTRATGDNTYAGPYRSLTITSFADDVTIDGQAIPNGFTWSVNADRLQEITNDTVVTGADYFVTEIRA